jgi:serine protease Do
MKVPTIFYTMAALGGMAASMPSRGAAETTKPQDETAGGISDAENDRAQDRFSRETPEIAAAWSAILETTRRSTARILREGKAIALATTVSEKGWILTKSSEVHDSKGKPLSGLSAQFPGGITLEAKITDVHNRYDLALLKVEARGLTPVEWDAAANPAPGSYLAAAGPERLPVAVGVVSVAPRNMDESHKGFLGISLENEEGKLRIREVGPESAASEAGLLKDDVLISINGQSIGSVSEFIQKIATHRPYDTVKVLIRRGQEDKELSATLRRREANQVSLTEDVRNMMSGALSRNRTGYPAALQHDMVLEPAECGGPLVDLNGHVVGLNIARSGRIECFAIPSVTLVDLLRKVDTGKFSRPELEDLRKEVKNADTLLERVRKDAERLKSQLQEAEGN